MASLMGCRFFFSSSSTKNNNISNFTLDDRKVRKEAITPDDSRKHFLCPMSRFAYGRRHKCVVLKSKAIEEGRAQLQEGVDGWKCHHMGEKYTKSKIGKNSDKFKIAVKKLQTGKTLEEEDKWYVRMLLKKEPTVEEEEKVEADSDDEEYIDAGFVLGTTCIVESFFSECKNILTDNRSSLSPYMFQVLAFLKANKDMWGLKEVAEAIQMAKNGNRNDREEEDCDYNE